MSAALKVVPGRKWRALRRLTQALSVLSVLLAPVLGGWQRMDRAQLATVEDTGWNLPQVLLEELPAGEPAAAAHGSNRVLGGGSAAEYLGIPAMDPMAGALAMIDATWTWRSALALGLPVMLALLMGRVFCGFFCIFGVLSRQLERAMVWVPFLPRLRLSPSRPLRFVVLGVAMVCSLQGLHVVLYMTLPYVLVQQSVYAAWLLGGGSVVLSMLLGLLVAGLLLGPTLYCAGLCPTGATLGTLGRARVVRLKVLDPPACGSRCKACNSACWLHLQPREGDPGPDCDLCARCVPACPRSNLQVLVEGKLDKGAQTMATRVFLTLATLVPTPARAEGPPKPRIVLEREIRAGATTVLVSALDVHGTALHRDWGVPQRGTDLQVYITRGELQEPGPDGVIEGREFYTGPLTIELKTPGRTQFPPVIFMRVNHPISAQRPSIYKRRLPFRLRPGDTLTVLPVPDYVLEPIDVVVTELGTRASWRDYAGYFSVAFLVFLGLLSLALAVPASRNAPRPAKRARTST